MGESIRKIRVIIAIIFLIVVVIGGTLKVKNQKKEKNMQESQNVESAEINAVTEQNTIEQTKEEDNESNTDSTMKNTDAEITENEVESNLKSKVKNEITKSTFDENAFENGHLKHYPNFAEQYAKMKIKKIGVDAPIYFGVTDEIILKGIGHDSGSYFAGENGTIIMCEHDYMNNFKRLGELKNGDIIEIQTNYGDFYYELYDEQIVLETETDKLPIQKNEEILMLYTCYNMTGADKTQYRYVVYAKKV
jgi:sortase A